MIRTMYPMAALALVAGLAAAGAALAQTHSQTETAPPLPSAAPASPPAQSSPPWSPSATPTYKPWDPNANQPTYSVNPPPDGASGIYLPAVVLGYAKSATGCVVVGCEDGPQVQGAAGSSSSGAAAPPPPNPGPADPH